MLDKVKGFIAGMHMPGVQASAERLRRIVPKVLKNGGALATDQLISSPIIRIYWDILLRITSNYNYHQLSLSPTITITNYTYHNSGIGRTNTYVEWGPVSRKHHPSRHQWDRPTGPVGPHPKDPTDIFFVWSMNITYDLPCDLLVYHE